jgi:hypothetical protein
LDGKAVLAYAAEGTNPAIGKIGKFSSRLDSAGGIPFGGIINIPTRLAYKFL